MGEGIFDQKEEIGQLCIRVLGWSSNANFEEAKSGCKEMREMIG